MANLNAIVKQLEAERDRIDSAIQAVGRRMICSAGRRAARTQIG
jgi:hypothetical protein